MSTLRWLVALLTVIGWAAATTGLLMAGLALMDRLERWSRR